MNTVNSVFNAKNIDFSVCYVFFGIDNVSLKTQSGKLDVRIPVVKTDSSTAKRSAKALSVTCPRR